MTLLFAARSAMRLLLSAILLFFVASAFADTDGDGVADGSDNCPNVVNVDQADSNNDGLGDACIKLFALSEKPERGIFEIDTSSLGAPLVIGSVTPTDSADVIEIVLVSPDMAYVFARDSNALIKINTSTAVVIEEVPLDRAIGPSRGFDIGPDGFLYGLLPREGGSENQTDLVAINPDSGRTSLVRELNTSRYLEALAIDGNGVFYAVDYSTLYTIEISSGKLKRVGSLGVEIDTITFASDGFLYAARSGSSRKILYRIDPANGSMSPVGNTGVNSILGLTEKENSDSDSDGVIDSNDPFPLDGSKTLALDSDSDGLGDFVDSDDDGDGVEDADEVAAGTDPFSPDTDADGIDDKLDNCPLIANEDQLDTDEDGVGNACDLYPEDPDFWFMKLEDAIAAIEDENLRGCLVNRDWASNLGSARQVTDVIKIHCNPPISTLAGIENFSELRVLTVDSTFYGDADTGSYFVDGRDLPRGELKDLSPLTGLHKMTSLTLINTKVEDISPLSSLTGLTILNLANSHREAPQITDISPLSHLINLRNLELGGHNISDISPLEGLNYLGELWLYDNNISDLIALPRPTLGAAMDNVGKPGFYLLFINGNPIEDYSVMSDIETSILGISVNRAEQTSFLAEYQQWDLRAFGEGATVYNFDFVQGRTFGCSECGLSDDRALTALVNRVNKIGQFGYLLLHRNNIRDLQPLAKLSYQSDGTLDLSANPVVSLWPLAESNVMLINAEQTALLCSHIKEFTTVTGKYVTSFTCLSDAGDEDEDGVINLNDAFPLDASESVDTDFDDIGNNEDPDDDNDTIDDLIDAFPLDDTEWADSDNDGVGDNSDVFPTDPNEAYDYDDDGIGDNADNCMLVANSDQTNNDGDAEGNDCDYDDDNDGVADEQELQDGTDPLDRSDCLGCYAPLDVDADGQVKALTDGLLIIRHLFGFSGNSLVSDALGSNAQRTDPGEIKAHVDSLGY